MDHGGQEKAQPVAAQLQHIPLAHGDQALVRGGIGAEELAQHDKGLGVAHQLHLRVEGGQAGDVGGVVRLHVGDDQIVRGAAVQGIVQVLQPGLGDTGIHRVHHGDLLVGDDIGIIAHADGPDGVLPLEQGQVRVVRAHIGHSVGDRISVHKMSSSSLEWERIFQRKQCGSAGDGEQLVLSISAAGKKRKGLDASP